MLLSIVIPVYNTKEYLESCLNSILACDCSDCEILLIDDGSTDGVSPGLCDRLAHRHSSLIRVIHQENKGLGGARNTGLEAACGEYVFFPDSDDTVAPETLSVLKRTIRQTKADIVAFNFFSDDGAGHLTPMEASCFCSDVPFRLQDRPEFLLSIPSACCRVWRRSLFLEFHIRYPSRVWYEDLRTTTKLFCVARSIVTIPDHLYHYLQRPGSIMHSPNVDRNREIIQAFDDVLGWYEENGLFASYEDILCRLCIDHLYLAASVRVATADPCHPLLEEFSSYLKSHFPGYQANPYLGQLPALRKLVFRLLEKKHYHTLRLLFRIKGN